MYDSNLNWVKGDHSSSGRGRPRTRCNVLARDRLRPPIGDVIVVQFADRHASEGAEDVRFVIDQEFGSPEWLRVEVGDGNVNWMYGDA